MDYPDDAGGVVFSPNGEHAATISGMQHFLQESDREPELDIDNQRIYPAKGIHVSLLSSLHGRRTAQRLQWWPRIISRSKEALLYAG